jgi:5'-3' exoribonuclease 1
MTDPGSSILDFYPEEFEADMNGKKQEWEAVVKIPFIDEQRLLQAMKGAVRWLYARDRLPLLISATSGLSRHQLASTA